jgi:D-alanine-D-alanine ligase
MKIVILHTKDAAGPPEDPVLGQIERALRAGGHDVSRLMVDESVDQLVAALRRDAPDLVFNLAESFHGKSALESNVAALLNLLGLHYTGSSPAGLIQAGDKTLTKKILTFHGIKTAKFATLYRGASDWTGDEIAFPLIVKPPQEDASIGVTQKSIVRSPQELLQTMSALQAEYQSPVLIEQFIEGREFYVGVLGNANAKPLPVIEMDFSKYPAGLPKIASYEAKWGEGGEGKGAEFAGTESVFPEHLDPELERRMHEVALAAFQALRLRDYARIDLRVTDAGEVYVIEVNPNCYLEEQSEFARAAQRAGYEYTALIETIVELASARYSR